mgnify:CR=1 FL=1
MEISRFAIAFKLLIAISLTSNTASIATSNNGILVRLHEMEFGRPSHTSIFFFFFLDLLV